jgi:hypothetical protein
MEYDAPLAELTDGPRCRAVWKLFSNSRAASDRHTRPVDLPDGYFLSSSCSDALLRQ